MHEALTGSYIGKELGHYRLIFLIGYGGFAEVYLGEHIHLKSFAAIKLLRSNLNDVHQENFINEARTLARLVHPHITRILDFGIEKGIAFLVMEFATHGTLRQRYPEGSRLPLPVIVDYMNQIAEALQCAHDQKFIHRDLKPENILIGLRDELLLSDFGAALFGRSVDDPTLVGRFMGTAPYTAPEQWANKPHFASDQYALGIIAYEWLCGRRPFRGKFLEIYRQHQNTPPQPLREIIPTLPEEIERVVLRTLEKDPAQRYPNVVTFAAELELAYEYTRRKTATARPIPTKTPSIPDAATTRAEIAKLDTVLLEQKIETKTPAPTRPTTHTAWQTVLLHQMKESKFFIDDEQPDKDLATIRAIPPSPPPKEEDKQPDQTMMPTEPIPPFSLLEDEGEQQADKDIPTESILSPLLEDDDNQQANEDIPAEPIPPSSSLPEREGDESDNNITSKRDDFFFDDDDDDDLDFLNEILFDDEEDDDNDLDKDEESDIPHITNKQDDLLVDNAPAEDEDKDEDDDLEGEQDNLLFFDDNDGNQETQESREARLTVQLHSMRAAYLNDTFAEIMESNQTELSSETDATIILDRGAAIKKNWKRNFSQPRRKAR